ncbi:MAG: LPS export ABC transporter periplasmic protein LptC [Methylophilaceae bacterium]|nr:LPS export ABC transporter periplasmic protein LptC [Methylophilaceae bacterium]
MKSFSSIWFALILLALLAGLTFWIDRTVQPPQPKRDGSSRHDPDYTVHNFIITKPDRQGNPRYKLAATEMRHYPDDDTTELVQPTFTHYSTHKPAIEVRSERGLISANGENVYFMDNVKVVRAATAQKGELTVLTDYLHVIPEKNMLKTDREVTILQAPRTVVRAKGMELYKNERILKLFGRVRVHYEHPEAPPAPPLTIDQVRQASGKPSPVAAANKGRTKSDASKPSARLRQAGPQGTQPKPMGKPNAKKGTPTKKPSKTRIRRHYEKPAN